MHTLAQSTLRLINKDWYTNDVTFLISDLQICLTLVYFLLLQWQFVFQCSYFLFSQQIYGFVL